MGRLGLTMPEAMRTMPFYSRLPAILALLAVGIFTASARGAAPTDRAGVDFFEKKIRPVLSANCYQCHASTSEKVKGGLMVDRRAALLKGGESGPAVVPGKPDDSPLIRAVRYDHDDLKMPPKQRLNETVVADLERWVAMGAPWPVEKPSTAVKSADPNSDYQRLLREHWAWQPVKPVKPPAVKDTNWPLDDVDRFVLAKLEWQNLKPVGPAERHTLLRRVTFDLTGLPPTPQEVEAFVSDKSADAYEKVVDRLLASPAFGERWGRHWLDVARYAESTGLTRNFPYPYAWRYRDYVIDSFNKDKPFDRFVMEQVAGDLLPHKSPAQRNEQLVATGFLALGVKDLNERNALQFQMDNVDEQIDTVTRGVMGLTVSCARCHDHKFDPIPTEDYYAIAGIFRSTDVLAGYQSRRGGNNYQVDRRLLARLEPTQAQRQLADAKPTPQEERRIREMETRLDRQRGELRELTGRMQKMAGEQMRRNRQDRRASQGNGDVKPVGQEKRPPGPPGGPPVGQNFAQIRRLRRLVQEKRNQVEQLELELEDLKKGPAAGAMAIGVRDSASHDNCRVFARGDVDKPGDEVERGVLRLMKLGSAPKVAPNRSGRLELAQWLTNPRNPLTTRVMVNRVWHHLFGQGLVRTVDNFGVSGEAPTHPELLDYLATRFVAQGWSVKKLVRSLVLTRTYQLAGMYDAANAGVDPSNRTLWRMAPRRLEAEAIRDAILATAGTLNPERPEGSVVEKLASQEVRPAQLLDPRRAGAEGFADRRSVFLPILRNAVPPVLDVFDFAEPSMVTGNRDVTTVAPQALFLMNNPFVIEQSRRFARRVAQEGGSDDAAKVDYAYRLALARLATDAERERAMKYLKEYAAAAGPNADPWASFCQALLASAEFRYVN